jgi:hypothetical protein
MSNDKYEEKGYVWGAEVTLIMNIPNEDTPFDLTEDLTSFSILKDYENNKFPIYNIRIYTNRANISKIQNYGSQVRYVANVKFKRYNKQEGKDDDWGAKTGEYTAYTRNEIIYLNSAVLKTIENERNQPLSESVEENEPNKAEKIPYDLILFEVKHLKWNSNIISTSYKDMMLENIIFDLIVKTTGNQPIMNFPQNNLEYKHINVIPLSLSKTLDYFQNYYGVFESGMKFFMDHKRIFCLGKHDMRNRVKYDDSPISWKLEVYDDMSIGTDKNLINKLNQPVYEVSDDFRNVVVRCIETNIEHQLANLAANMINGSEITIFSNSQNQHNIFVKHNGAAFPDKHVDKKTFIHSSTTTPTSISNATRMSIENTHKMRLSIKNVPFQLFDCDSEIKVDYSHTRKAKEFKTNFRCLGGLFIIQRNMGSKKNMYELVTHAAFATLGD